MINVEGTKITMTRGDTFRCTIGMVKDGEQVFPSDGDKVVFTVKAKYSDPEPLLKIDVPTDTMLLEIKPEQTKAWKQPKEYVYDVQLIRADGSVDTFIDRAILSLTEEVG